jgi:hypothetical protein
VCDSRTVTVDAEDLCSTVRCWASKTCCCCCCEEPGPPPGTSDRCMASESVYQTDDQSRTETATENIKKLLMLLHDGCWPLFTERVVPVSVCLCWNRTTAELGGLVARSGPAGRAKEEGESAQPRPSRRPEVRTRGGRRG